MCYGGIDLFTRYVICLIHQIISANAINDLCLGTEVTGTDKGKLIMEKGTHISFLLDLITSSKRSGNERFTNPSNKNADPKEEEIQQYFINECKELEKSPNIKNKLIVVDKHSSPSLGTQKPDFLLIPNGSHLDMLNVVAVDKIKKRGGDNFNNA